MNSERDYNDALLRARATERCRWERSYKRKWAHATNDCYLVWDKEWLPEQIEQLRKDYPEEATLAAPEKEHEFIYKHMHARYHVRGSLALGTEINEVVGVCTGAYLPYVTDTALWSMCHSTLYSLLLLEVPHITQYECLSIAFCNMPMLK